MAMAIAFTCIPGALAKVGAAFAKQSATWTAVL
jgi:hypothetical protein